MRDELLKNMANCLQFYFNNVLFNTKQTDRRDRLTGETDRQTDGQTDRQSPETLDICQNRYGNLTMEALRKDYVYRADT